MGFVIVFMRSGDYLEQDTKQLGCKYLSLLSAIIMYYFETLRWHFPF